MKAKKNLKLAAKRDHDEILNSPQGKSLLNKLLNGDKQKQNDATKTITCPDCGSALVFNKDFGLYMHQNCEELNCWYAADEFKKCVDNNQKRSERIKEFTGLKY